MRKSTRLIRNAVSMAVLSVSCVSAFAAQSLPYSCDFTTQAKLDTWEAVDVDGDGYTWELGKPDYGQNMAMSRTDYSNFGDTDNRLISPLLSLPAGVNLGLKFKFYTAYYSTEILDVYLSESPLTDSTEGGKLIETLNLNNYYGQDQTVFIPALETAGDYYLTFVHRASVDNNFGFVLYLTNLVLDEIKDGNLTGTVKCSDGPLAGASVSITGPVNENRITDENGRYSFEAIPAGSYKVEYTAFGYTTSNKTIEVKAEKTVDGSATLYAMQKAKVSGKVADSEGTPIEGAEVRLEGYCPFHTYTDAQGNYEIPGVYLYDYYTGSAYSLIVQRNNFVTPESKKITLYKDYSAGTTTLEYDILPPHSVTVAAADGKNTVSWERPVTISDLKHDNGNPTSPLGYNGGRYENILGSIYHQPMKVSDIEWYTFDNGEENDRVILYIIDLDENRVPTGNLVYEAMDVENLKEEWNRHHLETPIECPYGFMVAMSGTGNICLAMDDGQNTEPRTQVYSNTYASPDAYRYFEDMKYTGALCLRASGEKIQPEIPLKLKYNLYRLNDNDKENEDSWTTLASGTEEMSFVDTEAESLPRGTYRYAVKCSYNIGDQDSEAAFTPTFDRLQSTELAVNVSADSDPADAEGAKVTLTRPNEAPRVAYVTEGVASFSGIRKAPDYHLCVTAKGFNNFDTDLDLDLEEEYTVDALLSQILAPVANIDLEEDGAAPTLVYDFFSDVYDSFETPDYADFEINPAGDLGWQYFDGDGLYTYRFNVSQFPGEGDRMAAVILDATKTTPELTRSVAHTGSRALGFFCPRMTIAEDGSEIRHQADDWLISPELDFHRDFTFSFHAMTWEQQENRLENFRVAYSTTGSLPGDFAFIDGEAGVNVPLEYTEFSYTIPKEAKYVALNSRSNDVFLLLVDDIKMVSGSKHSGEAPSAGHFLNYEVSINGAEPVVTTSNSFELDPADLLAEGNVAEVVKVYNSGKSRPLTLEFNYQTDGIGSLNGDGNFAIRYTRPNITVSGNCSLIEVFSLEGVSVARSANASSLSVADLATGVYIVRATSTNGKIATARIAVN